MALEVSRIDRLGHAFGDFSIHLQSDIYLGWRFGSGRTIEPSLLDSIQHWLEHGRAVTYCHAYEDYLLVIIEIMADWSYGDGHASMDVSIWPRSPEEPGGDPVPFVSVAWAHREDGALQETHGLKYDFEHPALDPERFAQVIEQRKRHTRDDV